MSDEAHPGGAFNFSPATLADRRDAGVRGMREGLNRLGTPSVTTPRSAQGSVVHEVAA